MVMFGTIEGSGKMANSVRDHKGSPPWDSSANRNRGYAWTQLVGDLSGRRGNNVTTHSNATKKLV
jgi:hypothetical protein